MWEKWRGPCATSALCRNVMCVNVSSGSRRTWPMQHNVSDATTSQALRYTSLWNISCQKWHQPKARQRRPVKRMWRRYRWDGTKPRIPAHKLVVYSIHQISYVSFTAILVWSFEEMPRSKTDWSKQPCKTQPLKSVTDKISCQWC